MNISGTGEKAKILIVDSNSESYSVLSQIISPFYEVIQASQEEADSVIQENCNDLATAIIEIRQAYPIVKKLRGSIPTEKFPVLISTDIDNSELENELLNLEFFPPSPYARKSNHQPRYLANNHRKDH